MRITLRIAVSSSASRLSFDSELPSYRVSYPAYNEIFFAVFLLEHRTTVPIGCLVKIAHTAKLVKITRAGHRDAVVTSFD